MPDPLKEFDIFDEMHSLCSVSVSRDRVTHVGGDILYSGPVYQYIPGPDRLYVDDSQISQD